MDFSFIHISDIHLGRPFSDLSKYSYDEKTTKIYETAVEKTFNNIVDYAVLKNVDFVFIAGDTFDSVEQDFYSKLVLKDCLKKLSDADINVFLICGNHDPVTSYSKNTFNYDENSKIKIIGLNTNKYCDFELYDKNNNKVAILHALSFTEERMHKNPLEYFSKKADSNLFHIGLLHCDLNADSSSPYAPCNLSELKSFTYDYWALGHIHIPTNYDENIQYSGTIQGRNTKETGSHGIRYVKVSNNNIVKNSFVPMDVVRFEDIEIDISPSNDSTEAVTTIKEEINKIINKEINSCEHFLVRLKLNGCINFFSDINEEFYNILSEKIKNDFNQKVYISQITNSIIPAIDENLIKEDDGIAGEIYKTVNDNSIFEQISSETYDKLKNIISYCNFNEETYKIFNQQIEKSVKEECFNLCSSLYETESSEE